MDRQVDSRFQSRPPLKAQTRLELFNRYYLNYASSQFGKTTRFDIEVATLDPRPLQIEEGATHWAFAAGVALLPNLYFVYAVASQFSLERLLYLVGALLFTGMLAAAFVALYQYQSERKWVFTTRSARYPLITIPYRKEEGEAAQAFAERLSQAIEERVREREYQKEDLFAGEMRMLRRLAKKQVLSIELYDRAKSHMMRTHGETATAA